ncbi:hypothetical protein [Streptomyces sp. NPDC048650]|uniref:hypothetical protein n=1 Tax=unclassified Streptomyces TaxID=2593676 RepID=UPI00371E9AB8
MSGLVAAAPADDLGGADGVEVAIRWDLEDRAGADSVGAAEAWTTPPNARQRRAIRSGGATA